MSDNVRNVPTEPGFYYCWNRRLGMQLIVWIASHGSLPCYMGPWDSRGDFVCGPRIPDWKPPAEPETVSDSQLTLLLRWFSARNGETIYLYGAQLEKGFPNIHTVLALEELQRRREADKK